jgi:hypothetical protein
VNLRCVVEGDFRNRPLDDNVEGHLRSERDVVSVGDRVFEVSLLNRREAEIFAPSNDALQVRDFGLRSSGNTGDELNLLIRPLVVVTADEIAERLSVLQVTYRKGKPFSAYLHLSHHTGEKSARTVPSADGLLVID